MPPADPSVTVFEAAQKIAAENVAFIDVRTPEEYTDGHASGAHNYPLQDLDASRAEKLKQFAEVYVICQSGGRSSVATSKLRSLSVNAINIKGGTSAWQSANLPVEHG